MHRERRILTACPITFERDGEIVHAESEDLSQRGVFVHTDQLLPVAAVVTLTITLPSDIVVQAVARVAHQLTPGAAGALGRRPGMGMEFLEHDEDGRDQLLEYLEPMLSRPPSVPPDVTRSRGLVVVNNDPGELELIRSALTADGFEVRTAYSGAEAYMLCLEAPPEAVLASAAMPGMDGWELVRALMGRPALHQLPFLMIVTDEDELERLRSHRVGVSDFVRRPVHGAELCSRVRRLVTADRPMSGRVVLVGRVAEIGIRTLLSLLDFERKSGVLDLDRDGDRARLYLAGGRVVKVDGPGDGEPLDRVMRVLDWVDGRFEFSACTIVGRDEVGMRTPNLLLEHARVLDERSRRPD